MNQLIEILTIGREILDGRVVDTNSVFLAQRLRTIGLVPRWATRVDDDRDRMKEAFSAALGRSRVVLVTGGLGPTSDDLTAEVFADFMSQKVELNSTALEQVKQAFARMNRPMGSVQEKQALLPRGSRILENRVGTAPGFSCEFKNTLFYFMPGVPREMHQIFNDHVLPELKGDPNYKSISFATQFTSEGELQTRLETIIHHLPNNFELSFRTRNPENHISLYGSPNNIDQQNEFTEVGQAIAKVLGDDVFSSPEIRELEEVVIDLARQGKILLASVESCTGGLVASRLTDVAGASHTFMGSVVTYDNALKVDLGVEASLLRDFGAVSPQVAKAMAEGGLTRFSRQFPGRDFCVIATTGIAGPAAEPDPTNPTRGSVKPVGLCFLALAQTDKQTELFEHRSRPGLSRSECKRHFSQRALDLLRRRLLTTHKEKQ